jgi:hypothetical protein
VLVDAPAEPIPAVPMVEADAVEPVAADEVGDGEMDEPS